MSGDCNNWGELAKDRDEWRARALRSQADLVNYQSRATRELAEAEATALRTLVGELLPILDGLDHAAKDVSQDQYNLLEMRRGIMVSREGLLNVLTVRGLERIEALGKPYDPLLHEAALEREHLSAFKVVLEELRPGYLWNGNVLRAAQVVISKPKEV